MTIYGIGLSERDLKLIDDMNISAELEVILDHLEYCLHYQVYEMREFIESLLNKIAVNYKNKLIDLIVKQLLKGDKNNDDRNNFFD